MDQFGQFIFNHWALWVLLVSVLVLLFVNERITQKVRAKQLSPEASIELMNSDGALVIDLRDKDSYRKGHITNAINANKDDFLEQRMDKYKTKSLLFVCDRGLDSSNLAAKLRPQGFVSTQVLAGGMSAWQTQTYP